MMEIMLYNNKNYVFFIVFFCVAISNTVFADKAYFDLSDEIIKIETNFTGKEIIIFGLADPIYDTILVIKGPKKDATLTIKERLFGIWIKTKKFKYKEVPSIFFTASTVPINYLLDDKVIRDKGLNFKNFDYNSLNENNNNDIKIYEDSLYEWNTNFIRKQNENNFYKQYYLKIVDGKLFQTRVFFPSKTIPGIYNVEVLQVKDKKVINEDNKKIVIKKTGIGNKIYNFAQKQPVFYGILSIIFAVISGIMAATAFRRL